MSNGRDFLNDGAVTDMRSLNSKFERQQRANRAQQEADVVTDNGRRIMVRSPNGHYWSIAVSDAGVVSAVDQGTTL